MSDRPIIFSATMVRALMAGKKTQTRRVLKPHPIARDVRFLGYLPSSRIGFTLCHDGGANETMYAKLPYAPGDRLWVREAHAFVPASAYRNSVFVEQRVDPDDPDRAAIYREGFDRSQGGIRWLPSIHMPRWASRLTLHVTDVRVQRLQEISEEDARAKGVKAGDWPDRPKCSCDDEDCVACSHYPALYKPAFRHLWNTLHGPDAWDQNPWVAAITFTVQRTLMPRAYIPIQPKEADE